MGLSNFFGRIFKRATSYSGLDAWMGRPNNIATGRYLTPDDALKVSSFYSGTRVLAESVAMLPIVIYRKLAGGGKERNEMHPLWRILRNQPNPLQDPFQFKEMIMVHLIMRGNFYAQRIYNGRNKLLELYPLNPDCVEPFFEKPGDEDSLAYKVQMPRMGQVILPPGEILHIRGLGTCGVKGLSPIDLMMQTLGIAIAQEEHAGAFFGKGVRASGVLEHPNKLSGDAAKRIRESFDQLYAGSSNSYRTILLEEGLKWNAVSLTNEQSQFLESRKFIVTDIARWLRIPPHKIGDLERSTNNNIEHQGQEFLTDSIGPWLVRIEQAMHRQLLPEREWDETCIEFLVEALLRADTQGRYNAYAVGRNNGFLCVDEIRERENLNPLPDGKGKIFIEPMNMKPVGEDPPEDPNKDAAPAAGAKAEPEDDTPPNGTPPPEQENAWKIVFESRINRALRREVTARSRANSDNGKMADYLPVELEPDVTAALHSWVDLLPVKRNQELLLREVRMRVPVITKRFAEDWVKYSDEHKAEVDKWIEEKRSAYETNLLLQLTKSTFQEMIYDCKN